MYIYKLFEYIMILRIIQSQNMNEYEHFVANTHFMKLIENSFFTLVFVWRLYRYTSPLLIGTLSQ